MSGAPYLSYLLLVARGSDVRRQGPSEHRPNMPQDREPVGRRDGHPGARGPQLRDHRDELALTAVWSRAMRLRAANCHQRARFLAARAAVETLAPRSVERA